LSADGVAVPAFKNIERIWESDVVSWERAARAVLGRERERGQDGDGRQYGHRPTITLPRIAFLEKPLPSSFSDPIPSAPTKPKRKGKTS